MAKPEKVLFPHDEYRFDRVGKLTDGRLFMATVAGAWPEGVKHPYDDSWRDIKQWIAVVHLFDKDGHHLKTDSRLVAIDRDIHKLSESDRVLDELMKAHDIKDFEYGAIEVRLFSVLVNGIRHKLVYHADPDEDDSSEIYEWVEFTTVDVAFYEPWNDGLYDT